MGFTPMGAGASISRRPGAPDQNIVRPTHFSAQATTTELIDAFGIAHDVRIAGDTQPRVRLYSRGMQAGPGNAPVDVDFRRIDPVGTATYGWPANEEEPFEITNWFNVKRFGATGDGSTDDRAAIQAAIDAVPTGGGVVFFPPGDYRIDTTTVGLRLPFNRHILLLGASHTVSTQQHAVRIRRSGSGTATLLETNPTWNRATEQCRLGMVGLEINGNGNAGRVAFLRGLGQAMFDRVRFVQQGGTPTNPGVELIRPWNVRFQNCDFAALGLNELGPAAVRCRSYLVSEGGVMAEDTVNTVHFVNCEWESNLGTDLRLDGEGPTNKAHGITIVGCKFENGTTSGAAKGGPIISLGYTLGVSIVGCVFYLPTGASHPILRQDNSGSNGYCAVVGNDFQGAANQPLIDHNGSRMAITGNFFQNYQSGQVAIDIASTVPARGNVAAGNTYFSFTQANHTSAAPTNKRYIDNRTSPTGPQNNDQGFM